MTWNSSFEATPSGSDFASITASALREFKTTLREYIEVEHTWDASVSPIMTHKAGYCSVIKEVEELEYPLVDGSVQVTTEGRAFRVNDITEPVTFGTFDHNWLYGGDQPESHTQYLRLLETRDIDILYIGKIEGLDTIFSTPKANDRVMSQGEHGIPEGRTAKHKDNCISPFSNYLGSAKVEDRHFNMIVTPVGVSAIGTFSVSTSEENMFMPAAKDPDAYWTIDPNNGSTTAIKVNVISIGSTFNLYGRQISS